MDARCPNCGSLERHRLFALAMMRNNAIRDKDVLHFAPEPGLASWVCGLGPRKYITADLFNPADLSINIEQIDLANETFDVIICSHVLEHVNDFKALKEIRRVLRPGGVAIVMIPIIEGWDQTYENPLIKDGADSLLHFGQEDHVRFYGRDFRDRVASAGLMLAEYTATEPDVSRHGLARGEKVFFCTKTI
jgi:SAM-dependent methyltransferase